MSYEITGQIKAIYETQEFASGFTKREFVVTTDEKYPQDIKLEFVKDKCAILNEYNEGQTVTVNFNLRGNEYKERYYVNLVAWNIEGQPFDRGGEDKAREALTSEGEGEDFPF